MMTVAHLIASLQLYDPHALVVLGGPTEGTVYTDIELTRHEEAVVLYGAPGSYTVLAP